MRFLAAFLALASVALLLVPAWSVHSYFRTSSLLHLVPDEVASFLDIPKTLLTSTSISASDLGTVGRSLISTLLTILPQTLSKAYAAGVQQPQATEYPYFRWIPDYEVSALPSYPDEHWSAPCFTESSARVEPRDSSGLSYSLILTLAKPSSLLCNDFYLLGTVEGVKLQAFHTAGVHNITWDLKPTARPAEIWDIQNKGVRVFRFLGGEVEIVSWLLSTVELFEPILTPGVSDKAAAANLDFLKKYANIHNMDARAIQSVDVDESLIQSGDFMGVIRLDGLDPMLAWAMGAHTGHTTIAMRDETGALYIHESTTNSTYWPQNGIQKTPYATWKKQAKAAGYNFLWAPLTDEVRANFNASAALEFYETVAGFDYGYYNMLWSWVDTFQDNYPCLPPGYDVCLEFKHIEVLMGILDNAAPSASDMLFRQAFNNRLGTKGLMSAELFQTADSQGLESYELAYMVEKDSYLYDINRNWIPSTGPSMVCCVFVCEMWKHGGVFGDLADDINCAELTNWDDYVLTVFEAKPTRPQACEVADPLNTLCQLEGAHSLYFNDYSTKKPYAHMAEKCPSRAPNYQKPSDC